MYIKKYLITPFLIALQFLSIIPVRLSHLPTAQQNAYSVLFYPCIGLLIGSILFLITILLNHVPVIVLSCLVLLLWVWLTGGLHLDGLADTADAWVGGFGDKQRTLDIMKDPACGPTGVLSLILCCALKWSALYVLLNQKLAIFLLFIPMLGRLSAVILLITTPYVRKKGLGTSLTSGLSKTWSWIIIFIYSVIFLMYLNIAAILCLLCCIISLSYWRNKQIQRIDGITGDTIGATIEIIEVTALLSIILFMT